ncbi:MAG: PH domain-containing protein [Acidobacteriota bacterium]
MSQPPEQPLVEPATATFDDAATADRLDDAATSDMVALPTISLLFMGVGAVRNLLLTSVALFTVSGGQLTWLVGWLAFLIVPGLVGAILRYAVFRYRLGDEELHLRDGILQRNERHVPYARIQNVDLVQNPIHRWLDVATVRLETASGGEPEASISVLPLATVEELRQRVLHGRRAVSAVGSDAVASDGATADTTRRSIDADLERSLLDVPVSELALLGLLSNKGLLVVAAAVGLLQQLGFFDDPTRIEAFAPIASSWVEQIDPTTWTPWQVGGVIVVVTLTFILFTRLLSAGWMVFTLWRFQLTRRGEDLRTIYGLVTRITATIPRRRVQLLSVRESFLQGLLGRASVQVETAGGGGQAQGPNEQGPGASRLWLAPMVARGDVAELITEVLPEFDFDSVDWRPIARRALRRVLRKHLIAVALLTALAVVVAGVWGLSALVLLPYVWIRSVRRIRRAGWAITDKMVLYRSGIWGRSTSAVPLSKVQTVLITQTPFDRRWGMATVHVDTAGARLGSHRVEIPYLDMINAHALARHLASEAARRSFRW